MCWREGSSTEHSARNSLLDALRLLAAAVEPCRPVEVLEDTPMLLCLPNRAKRPADSSLHIVA